MTTSDIIGVDDPSFQQLIVMDDNGSSPEEIGCYLKRKVSEHVDFYNGSFHIEEGLLENLMTNLSSDCFNSVSGEDFGCMHFYRIFSCFKVYVVKGMKECDKLSIVYDKCRPTETNKEHLKCIPKCVFEQMNFFEENVFNINKLIDWFEDHLPPQKGVFLKGILQSCYNKSLEKNAGDPTYNCNYFYRYSSCLFVSILKGFLDMAENPPNVKGFIFDL